MTSVAALWRLHSGGGSGSGRGEAGHSGGAGHFLHEIAFSIGIAAAGPRERPSFPIHGPAQACGAAEGPAR